jgi:hypothetical protein
MGNIDDRESFAEHLWDWGFLNSALPGKIRPMDIDGIVERNGHFLVLEGKSLGASMSTGQRITLENLSEKPKVHVLILYGEPKSSKPEKMRLLDHHSEPVSCDPEMVRKVVKSWVKHAESC